MSLVTGDQQNNDLYESGKNLHATISPHEVGNRVNDDILIDEELELYGMEKLNYIMFLFHSLSKRSLWRRWHPYF